MTCIEVGRNDKRAIQNYVENAVTESMLRRCPNCQKQFFKLYGCNKMTCTCGVNMCYLCKIELPKDQDVVYDHFDDNDE